MRSGWYLLLSWLLFAVALVSPVRADADGAAAPPPGGEVIALVTVRALPGRADDVAERFESPRSRCTDEIGCLGFDIHRSQADPRRIVVIERWASKAHHRAFFDAASASPTMASFLELIEGGIGIEYLTARP